MNFRRELIDRKLLKKNSKTTNFFLPTYGYPLKLYSDYFIGCYIKDREKQIISFVFENPEDSSLITSIIQMLSIHFCYKDINYDGENADEIVIDMNLDPTYSKDFKLFLEGKYSKLSNKLKEILIKIHEKKVGVDIGVTMWEVLYPTIERRLDIANYLNVGYKEMRFELLDPPNSNYEDYLTIEQLKEKYGTKQQITV